MTLQLAGNSGKCHITNIHIEPEPAKTAIQQRAIIRAIHSSAPSQWDALHILGGDLNFGSTGEQRFNSTTSSWSSNDESMGKYWEELFVGYTEWHQDEFTRGQQCESGFVMA
eukprot:50089-Karenia_brevis.AAC.1